MDIIKMVIDCRGGCNTTGLLPSEKQGLYERCPTCKGKGSESIEVVMFTGRKRRPDAVSVTYDEDPASGWSTPYEEWLKEN